MSVENFIRNLESECERLNRIVINPESTSAERRAAEKKMRIAKEKIFKAEQTGLRE